ncbi:MAG: ankyrin repeat domain-containing protein, partial [Caldilineaceae bacterium]|nr:ankyrin repeat domain-containing protein [Caldilineaceae bacterium]
LGADPSLDRGKLLSAASWNATAGDNPAVAATIVQLVAAGEDVNATDGHGYGPLHCAVHGYNHTPDEATWWNASSDGSDVSATRALLAHGADPNLAGANGMTPLLLAVESSYESTPCVAALLEQGADPALAGHGGITPLMRAVNAGEAENVRLLLAQGVDVQQRDRYGHDALHYATERLQQLMTPEQADEDENEEAGKELLEPELRAWMAELNQRAIDKAALCVALLKTALG